MPSFDSSKFEIVPFSESESIARTDGRYWVYGNAHDGNASAGLEDASAIHCVLGGTVEDPEWVVYGMMARAVRADQDPNIGLENFRD